MALPERLFYNTGIETFVWLLSNKKKGTKRENKIQLIDATGIKKDLRRNLGAKSAEISERNKEEIIGIYQNFAETEHCRILAKEEFQYYRIFINHPVLQPNGKPLLDLYGNIMPDKKLAESQKLYNTDESGIRAYYENEILPLDQFAWIDHKKTRLGYEINFKKYFTKIAKSRPLQEITQDIIQTNDDIQKSLSDLLGGISVWS